VIENQPVDVAGVLPLLFDAIFVGSSNTAFAVAHAVTVVDFCFPIYLQATRSLRSGMSSA
jgi:hypothetical protein